MNRAGGWLVLAALAGCGDTAAPAVTCDAPPAAGSLWFEERAEAMGITFSHHMSSELCHLTDTVGGPGVCAFDFDRDADIDLYFVDRKGGPSALYRNDGERFSDVAAQLGVDAPGDATGCLAFDYDGDADLDLFVTGTDMLRLYRNDGESFSDVTGDVGLGGDTGFSTSATAGDIDADGDLDLFVGRLVKLETCPDACYLFPINCEAEVSVLFINEGGAFRDETAARGITAAEPTLATLFFDEDKDGDLDLYVGNDMGLAFEDRLYQNDGTGHFRDEAENRGYTAAGTDTMGVDVGDVDGDGLLEMVTTDFRERPTRLYNCFDPQLPCSYEALPEESTLWVNWAVGLVDFDADGDLDLFQTSGDVYDPELLGNPNQLFLNDGKGRFAFAQPKAGDGLELLAIHRGAAFADLDGDLDIDIAVAVNGGRPKLLYNVGASGHSIMVDVGPRGTGARVTVETASHTLTEQALIGGSFLSSSDPRLHFGLGAECQADVTVAFLDGRVVTRQAEAGEIVRVD